MCWKYCPTVDSYRRFPKTENISNCGKFLQRRTKRQIFSRVTLQRQNRARQPIETPSTDYKKPVSAVNFLAPAFIPATWAPVTHWIDFLWIIRREAEYFCSGGAEQTFALDSGCDLTTRKIYKYSLRSREIKTHNERCQEHSSVLVILQTCTVISNKWQRVTCATNIMSRIK